MVYCCRCSSADLLVASALVSVAVRKNSNTVKMATHGAALQTQNNELVKCIEDLKEKRDMLRRNIREDEAEKSKIQQDLQVLP